MTYNYLDPTLYGPGKGGPPLWWLRWRLAVHGALSASDRGPLWHDVYDKADVRRFQLALGYTGTGADGYVGPKTLAALAKDPAVPYSYPADLFGKGWKLTTVESPELGERKLVEVKQPALATYDGRLRFMLNPVGLDSVIFRSFHGDPTTSGSSNPRSELREMTADGMALADWDGRTGRHTLDLDLAVNRLTVVKPDVVVGQIHNPDDDVTVFRCEGRKDKPGYARMWATSGNTAHGHLLDDAYKLGERIKLGFVVSAGEVKFTYRGLVVPDFYVSIAGKNYFKTGCYLQSNPTTAPSESNNEWAEVLLYGAKVSHA